MAESPEGTSQWDALVSEHHAALDRIAELEAEVERLQTVIAMRDDEDAAVYRDLEAD